jgi:hypothetical protein
MTMKCKQLISKFLWNGLRQKWWTGIERFNDGNWNNLLSTVVCTPSDSSSSSCTRITYRKEGSLPTFLSRIGPT